MSPSAPQGVAPHPYDGEFRIEEHDEVLWPKALVQELADRRAVIVLGSGLSATAKGSDDVSPPSWSGLISKLTELAAPKLDRPGIEALVEERKFVEAAEELKTCADDQTLAHAFREVLVEPHFMPSDSHGDVMAIDQPVVINLNYDRIYETHCLRLDADSYVVTHYYQSDFIRNIRSPLRVILKLHGSTDDPSQVVFSQSDYTKAQSDHSETFGTLAALLLTRTVLFIGCGFNGDPDVERLLTENSLRQQGAYPHYALIQDQGEPSAFKTAKKQGLNLQYIEYPTEVRADGSVDHSEFARALSELREQVLARRQSSV